MVPNLSLFSRPKAVLLAAVLVAPFAPASLGVPEPRQERQETFDRRNAPEELDKLGRQLLGHTFLGEWSKRDFHRPGRWEELDKVRARMDQGDYAGALELFKSYTFEKLRMAESYGLPKTRFDAFSGGVPGAQWMRPLIAVSQRDSILKSAQNLMDGTIKVRDQRVEMGAPGAVDWERFLKNAPAGGQGWPYDVSAFNPLLAAYILTGKAAYLEKWAAYADDWSMNQHTGIGTTNVADMPDHWASGAEDTLTLFRYLGCIAAQPNESQSFPASTFARVLVRLLDDYVPASIIYNRSDPGNWADASLTALPVLGLLLDEYHIAPQLLHESRRRLELLATTHNLPDGPDLDTTVGYGFNFLLGAGTFLNLLQSRDVSIQNWMLPAWEQKEWRSEVDLGPWAHGVREEMRKRARFLAAHTMANGEWPIGGSRSHRHNRANDTYDRLQYFVPEIFRNQDVAGILDIGTGRASGIVPSFTSERFPYAGHTYIRAGWKPSDPYLYMYCSPWPMVGELSNRNNNAIGLSAYGCDLLETGENGTYDEPHTPVKVDGQDQFFRLGIPVWGHRGPLLTTSVMQQPPAWRWHSSEFFTVAEGIYAGAFGKDKTIQGVTHQRIVQYVRQAGLWIVTDRLRGNEPHLYTLDWRFGIQPGDPTDFTAEQIKVDESKGTIKSDRSGRANVSLYHFASEKLKFSTQEERTDPKRGYRIHDFLRVSGSWNGENESVVVTVIYPRDTKAADLTRIEPVNKAGVVGFEATTPDGLKVSYRTAAKIPAPLAIGDLRCSGESLLEVTDSNGSQNGIVLGRAVKSGLSNYEFITAAGQTKMKAIHTPVDPVRIAPVDSNVFQGQQRVTLDCPTTETEIRYTLDGTEPGPSSPLYREPFVIDGTTLVKARAFRRGAVAIPKAMGGTTASVVTEAVYTQASSPEKSVQPGATQPGLHYDYYEGRWQDLLTNLDRLVPVQSGAVRKLFDLGPKGKASNYAFKYTGYIDILKEGIYNFHAPPEFYEPNIMAGYNLQLFIDGKEWYPATSRHALGTWSVALQQGKHLFTVIYADFRADGVQKMNKPGQRPYIWEGSAPDVELSGPGLKKGPIPTDWLFRKI